MTAGPDVQARLQAARTLLSMGRYAESRLLATSVLAERPGDVDAIDVLACSALAEGKPERALEWLDRAVARAPRRRDLHTHRAVALRELGRSEEALAAAERAVDSQDGGAAGLPAAWNARGLARLDLGRPAEAADDFRAALSAAPEHASARGNLALALLRAGRPTEAVTGFDDAIARSDRAPVAARAELHLGRASALSSLGRLTEAAAAIESALALDPARGNAWRNLGNVRLLEGRVAEAIECHARAIERSGDAAIASNRLHSELYAPGRSRADLRSVHEATMARVRSGGDEAVMPRPAPRVRPAGARLRVGFVSPDFARHPVGYLSVRVIEALRAAGVDAILYSDAPAADALTARFRAAAARFDDVRGVRDDDLAARIRADALDALVDLAGHTAGNRLALFRRRPAPVQASWIGYPSTTGVREVDAFLTDALLVPLGAEDEFVERVVRLDSAGITFDPPAEAPAIADRVDGPLRFGAFHHPAKLGPPTLDRIAAVLRRVPDAELELRYRGYDDPSVRARIAAEFSRRGVAAGRLRFRGFAPLAAALEAFGAIDVMLDATPFSGGLTSLTALWMGAPVVATAGEILASRQTAAYLHHLGLHDLVGRDEQDYAEVAVGLARDADRRWTLRASLRDLMAGSALMDGARTARALAAAIRELTGGATDVDGEEERASPYPRVAHPAGARGL